jgi:predicted amidohydrolase
MTATPRRSLPAPVTIAAAQMHCVPANVEANLATIENLVRLSARDGAGLVILPETATTGYFISDRLPELAEPDDGPTATRLGLIARDAGVHLAVGMAISEGGRFYDAQLLFGPDGARLATYRKAHLFSAERDWFCAGDTPTVVDTAIGRIGMTICYDLIFPEYTRRLVDLGADLIINSTNWITDEFQRDRWGWNGATVQSLAATRALENGVWLAMANCVGPEWTFDSIGHSCVVAPSGKIMSSVATGQGIAIAEAVFQSEDLDRWKSIATYLGDRRPELY